MAVHSQLISCAASEVAAMIEGAMWHGTTMALEGNYVDSHGQTEIGFAIALLLGFDLLPRIKQINKVKHYQPDRGNPDAYPGLKPAMLELGRVQKTIFIARYLRDRDLQREINEGLNLIEAWNRVNTMIFYGKSGESASNRREQQELGMLSPEDFRGLTPLFWAHVLPYCEVKLNTTTRLALSVAQTVKTNAESS